MKQNAELIEKEFNVLFEKIGYQRVDNLIHKSPDFANADYINLKKKVVVELKVIENDFFENGGIIDSQQMIVTVPKNVEPDGQGFYEFTIPKINRENKIDTLEEPIRRILKKANKQLRETKKNLLEDNGVGFLILALNMKTTFNPEILQKLTIKLLEKEFKSINGVIYCTPKIGMLIENDLFQPLCLHSQESDLAPKYVGELMFLVDNWCDFIDNGGHD